jgi:hypothetical protein
MPSLLRKREALNYFSIALILSAVLDALSTIYACHFAGTWDVEANPVFRGLERATTGTVSAVILLIAMKATSVGVLILWLRLTLSRVPDLYPPLGRQRGFFQFANFLFCGAEVRGWRSLFLVPPVSRLYRGLSVPVTVAAILGMCSASMVNTFHLLNGFSSAVIFWLVVAVAGAFAGLEMLHRDFFALCRNTSSQSARREDCPSRLPRHRR